MGSPKDKKVMNLCQEKSTSTAQHQQSLADGTEQAPSKSTSCSPKSPTPPTVPRGGETPRGRKLKTAIAMPIDCLGATSISRVSCAPCPTVATVKCCQSGDFRQCQTQFWDKLHA